MVGSVDVTSLTDRELAARPMNEKLAPHPYLPGDTRLWAALQNASGGSWGGCVYDTDRICELLGQALAANRADR